MAEISAGAGIHGCYQHNRTGVGYGTVYSGDGHAAVFDWLPKDFHRLAGEFRKFVKKQNTRLTARKKPFGVGCFPKIYVSFTYPIPLPYGGGNIGVNTPVARVGEAVSSI